MANDTKAILGVMVMFILVVVLQVAIATTGPIIEIEGKMESTIRPEVMERWAEDS